MRPVPYKRRVLVRPCTRTHVLPSASWSLGVFLCGVVSLNYIYWISVVHEFLPLIDVHYQKHTGICRKEVSVISCRLSVTSVPAPSAGDYLPNDGRNESTMRWADQFMMITDDHLPFKTATERIITIPQVCSAVRRLFVDSESS